MIFEQFFVKPQVLNKKIHKNEVFSFWKVNFGVLGKDYVNIV